jgi:hypothetical protein
MVKIPMHEYIRETSSWKYENCKCCSNRTSFTCVRCKYCWSCHWKKERLEKNELLSNRIPSSVRKSPFSPRQKIINVFGEEEPDPICNYLNCNHAFSLHKDNNNHCTGHDCNCQHPQNTIIGVKKINSI